MTALQTTPQAVPELADSAIQRLVPVNTMSMERCSLLFSDCELQPLRKGDKLFVAGDSDDRIYYLLEGKIELRDQQRKRTIMEAGTQLPLSPLRPHTETARALSAATVLHCRRRWLDALLLPPLLNAYSPARQNDSDAEDWLQRLLASDLFKQLPAPNLQQIFSQCEPLAFGQGQSVIEQGGEDDGFYIIQSGRCEVVQLDDNHQVVERLALLKPGDWFGEVSLLTDCPSSVAINMLDEGALLRLSRRGFDDLIRRPLMEVVDADAGRQHVEAGANWLDVREEAEVANDPLENARQYAFSVLLRHIDRLEQDRHYVLVCDSGVRSAFAALLLGMRGYSVSWLRGGLAAIRGWQTGAETNASEVSGRQDPLLQSLRTDLTRLLRHVDHAMSIKGNAESARHEAECAARKQMDEERARLHDQALQVRNMLEKTQKLQRRLAEEKERLYTGLKQREQAVEERINNLNAYIEKRVAEERDRIENQYRSHEKEIEHLSSAKQAVESRVQEGTATDADKHQARQALESEFEQFSQALQDAENERNRVQAATVSQELVSEISQEMDSEDQSKLAAYQASQSSLTQKREQLEDQARQLSSAVQETLVEKQASAAVRDALMEEAAQLDTGNGDTERSSHTDDALRAATARYNDAEAAHQEAINAEQQNKAALTETEEAETDLLQNLNAEIEEWLQEQASQQPSQKQQELVRRYEETMKRTKEEALKESEQERTRDDLLLSDINAELEQIAEQRNKQND